MNQIVDSSVIRNSSLVVRNDSHPINATDSDSISHTTDSDSLLPHSIDSHAILPPGEPVTEKTIKGKSKAYILPWQALVPLNPYTNPNYVPPGTVVKLPPGTAWMTRPGESIYSLAMHFVQCAAYKSYYYAPNQRLDPYALAHANGIYSIYQQLPLGVPIRLPPDAGYLAYSFTTFGFISSHLSFGPHVVYH